MRHPRPLIFALTALLLVAACSESDEFAETSSEGRQTAVEVDEVADDEDPADETPPSTIAPVDDEEDDEDLSEHGSVRPECEPGPGRTVTPLDPVVVPGLDIPAEEFPAVTLDDGTVVPGFEVEAASVPERVVDTGCIIEYDAPAGCLGAVEISGFEIPGAAIPGAEIPGAKIPAAGDQPSVSVPAASSPSASVPPVSVPSVRVEQVCQIEPSEEGEYVSSVYRSSAYRSSGYRSSVYRPSVYRSSLYRSKACDDDGDCVPAVRIPSARISSVRLPSVRVPSVRVPSARLPSYRLEGTQTDVVEGDDDTSYLAPADVLFAFDESELGPDAIPTLQAIVAELHEAAPDAAITVEGHTDSVGGDAYNQKLSEDRARAVAEWLSGEGGIGADRISTAGHGATAPVAPNTNDDGSDNPDGRAQNRRVVISVATG